METFSGALLAKGTSGEAGTFGRAMAMPGKKPEDFMSDYAMEFLNCAYTGNRLAFT